MKNEKKNTELIKHEKKKKTIVIYIKNKIIKNVIKCSYTRVFFLNIKR